MFSYFAILLASTVLDAGDSRRSGLAAVVSVLRHFAGEVGTTHSVLSPDASATLLRLAAALLVALLLAGIWTALDRKTNDQILYVASRVALRYFVGVTMVAYGGIKLIPSQFPPPTLTQLAEPLGHATRMELLWVFMGRSAPYEMFAGLAEFVGGLLLFSRQTTTLGGLILLGVLSNVALMNFAYDVPVKGLSLNLLLMALVLVAPDFSRLRDFLVHNRATSPADLGPPISSRALNRTGLLLKPLIMGAAIVAPLMASYVGFRAARSYGPLYGVYDVVQFMRNSDTLPLSATQGGRWRRVIIDVRGDLTIQHVTDTSVTYRARVDTVRREIAWWPAKGSRELHQFAYAQNAGGLQLKGLSGLDSVTVELKRLNSDSAFRLLR